jgi:MFS family permease
MSAAFIPSVKLGRKNFWVLCLTLFMIAYNVAVLPPIMPLLVRELNASIGYVQGALVLFSLVTAAFAPTCENLCQFYGRTRVFGMGLILYGIGIATTALSPNISLLVMSFSLLTGLAATPLVSTPWTIMDYAYDGKQEQQAMLAFTLASTLGGLGGAILGGLIASQAGWRWAFLPALVVFGLVAALGRSLPETTVPRQAPIDWVGGLVSFVGLGSILLGISLAGEFGWWQPKRLFSIAGVIIPPFALSIVPTLISVGVICLGFFVVWQRQQANQAGASLLRVGLLRKPVFVFGLLTAMLHSLVTSGIQFNLYQFLPAVLPLNPWQTALTVLPYNLTMVVVIVALLKAIDLDRQFPPKYIVYFGLALDAVGIGALYAAIGPNLNPLHLLLPLIVMGIGSGCFLAYIGGLTYSVASWAEKPEGTGIYRPVQQLGNSLGRGILGTILISFTSTQIVDRVLETLGKTLSIGQRQEAISTLQRIIQTYSRSERRDYFSRALPEAVKSQFPSILEASAISGMRTALLVALGVSLVCLLLATMLPKSAHHSA